MEGKKDGGTDPPQVGGTGQSTSAGGGGDRVGLSDSTFTLDDLTTALSRVNNPSAPPVEGDGRLDALVGELSSHISRISQNAQTVASASDASAPSASKEYRIVIAPDGTAETGVLQTAAALTVPGIRAKEEDIMKFLKIKYQSGSKNEFRTLLRHYYPLESDYDARYKEITGEERKQQSIRRPPAGGHGSLFEPQDEQMRVLDSSSRFALERAIQDGFVNTRTGAPVGDLKFLEKQRSDNASNSVPLNPEDFGVSYTFTMMRDIFDPKVDTPLQERFEKVQTAFSPSVCEDMVRGLARAQSDQYEPSHNTADTIPCPSLKADWDKSGDVDPNTLKTLEAIYHRKSFSGEVGNDIEPDIFFRKMYNFLNGRFNNSAAYMIMSVACTGRAQRHIARCEGMNLGFLYMWDTMTKLYMATTDPDAAEKIIIEMRSHRPRNVAKYLCKLWKQCKEAAYAKPPELRPSAEINRFRDEADRMVKKYYPFVHKAITQRDKRMSIPWKKERDRLISQGRCPDANSTIKYHPLASYFIYCVEEIGDLAANNPKREMDDKSDKKDRKRAKKSASVANIDLDSPPTLPKSSAAGSQSVLDSVHKLLEDASSSDDAMYSESEADPGSDNEGSVSSDVVDLEALKVKPANFQHLPTGAEPRRDDRKGKGKAKVPGDARVCLLCGGPHQYGYCPTYRDCTPVRTRCTQNPKCGLFHPGPCKYEEAQKAIAEREARKKEREAANPK